MRIRHVLDAKRPFPLVDFTHYCSDCMRNKDGFPRPDPLLGDDFRFPEWHSTSLGDIWTDMIDHVFARDGPFAKTDTSTKPSRLGKLVIRLYPQWSPKRWRGPIISFIETWRGAPDVFERHVQKFNPYAFAKSMAFFR